LLKAKCIEDFSVWLHATVSWRKAPLYPTHLRKESIILNVDKRRDFHYIRENRFPGHVQSDIKDRIKIQRTSKSLKVYRYMVHMIKLLSSYMFYTMNTLIQIINLWAGIYWIP